MCWRCVKLECSVGSLDDLRLQLLGILAVTVQIDGVDGHNKAKQLVCWNTEINVDDPFFKPYQVVQNFVKIKSWQTDLQCLVCAAILWGWWPTP